MSSVGGDSAPGAPSSLGPGSSASGSQSSHGHSIGGVGMGALGAASGHGTSFKPPSTSAFVDLLDPFKKAPLKQNKKKSQGSSRYRLNVDLEFQQLPLLKGQCFSDLIGLLCKRMLSSVRQTF